MTHSIKKLNKPWTKAKASINKTSQLEQVRAQIEANLSREEYQKVAEKSKNSYYSN